MKQTTYLDRLDRLQSLLGEMHCDALLIEDKIDLYYMTGLELSKGSLIVSSKGGTLFVDGRYFEECQESCPFAVEHDTTMKEWISKKLLTSSVGFDPLATIYQRYLEWQKNGIPSLIPLPPLVKQLRSIKDEKEIALLRQAAILGSEGYDFVIQALKENVTESFLAAELEIFWKRKGGNGLAFDPIIAFGANSSKPHYKSSDKKLKKGDTVLIDIGVNWKHYHSDMTRTVFFGFCSDAMKKIYEVVLEAQLKVLEVCHPGYPIAELDRVARSFIESRGYGDHFNHNLGHGVGLEIHELPFIRHNDMLDCLQKGMVITIEPGIYLPGIGGVRIEDAVLITAEGHENLTNRFKDLKNVLA